ncbi:MAG: gephyrin-like molybdotransferase Glp [Thiohalocapsa sp.]
MNSPPSCQDPYDNAISAAEARDMIGRFVRPVMEIEHIPLRDTLGRVLAADLISPMNVPPYRNSAMDGYALRGSDLNGSGGKGGDVRLQLFGSALAGHPFDGAVPPGGCVRIMTGAPMPEQLDTVVIQERVSVEGDLIRIPAGEKRGVNVRQAGEDIAANTLVIAAGSRITPARMGLLASLGIADVRVHRRVRVAFYSSGDEIRSVGEPLGPGDIYNSNSYTMLGMLREIGVETIDLGLVSDDPQALQDALLEGARSADLVLTTGGISVGEADHIGTNIRRLGEVYFNKVAIKPGRPLTFASLGQALFFGLPGNPVAVMTTFQQFVRPALRLLGGEAGRHPIRFKARCEDRFRHKPGRTEYRRGRLSWDAEGIPVVVGSGSQGSGVLSSMSQGNCFIVIGPEQGDIAPGERVTVEPFSLN